MAYVGIDGNATINSNGDVQALTQGVSALVEGNGNATANHSGNVTSTAAFGIRADVKGNGNATIDSGGTVMAFTDGVTANVEGNGNALAQYDGDVTSQTTTGIEANVKGNGNATIDAGGMVNALFFALHANVQGTGNASITYHGDINSSSDSAAVAIAHDGDAHAEVHGTTTAANMGLQADALGATGDASVLNRGDVTTQTDDALHAYSANGVASVDSIGDLYTNSYLVPDCCGGDPHIGGGRGIAVVGHLASWATSIGDVTALGQDGIFVYSGTSTATLTSTGTIWAYNQGLFARGATGATVTNTGDVETLNNDAVFASTNSGTASVHSEGNVLTNDGSAEVGRGVVAISGTGPAQLYSNGTVTAGGDAVFAKGTTASVEQYGAVESKLLNGISAYSYAGAATVTGTGSVMAQLNGIVANSHGNSNVADFGDVGIDHEGSVTAQLGFGVQAYTQLGNASVMQTGNVWAHEFGVTAISDDGGNSDLTLIGDSHSEYWDAVFAQALAGTTTIVSNGDQSGLRNAIFGLGSGHVSITQTGDATAGDMRGIYAESTNENVEVDATGHIVSNGTGGDADGIFAYAPTGHADVTVGAGSVVTGGSDRARQLRRRVRRRHRHQHADQLRHHRRRQRRQDHRRRHGGRDGDELRPGRRRFLSRRRRQPVRQHAGWLDLLQDVLVGRRQLTISTMPAASRRSARWSSARRSSKATSIRPRPARSGPISTTAPVRPTIST